MNNTQNKFPIAGYIFLVGTAFFTAISYIIGRSLNSGLDPETTIFFWFFGALIYALTISFVLPSQRLQFKNIRKYKNIFIYISIFTSIGAAFWMVSLWIIGPALTSFLMKSQTLFSLLLGVIFLGERLNKGESIGIVITIVGGLIVAFQKDNYLLYGTIMAILAAFFYSAQSFIVKKIAQDLNMLTVTTLRAVGVSIILFLYLIVTGTLQMPTFNEIIFMSLGGLSGAYIAKACQFQSIKLLDVSRSTAVMPMESLFVVLFSFLIFRELPSTIKLIGGAAIIIGVVFLVIFRGEKNDVL